MGSPWSEVDYPPVVLWWGPGMRNAVMLAVCTLPAVAWASPEEVSVPTLSRDLLAVEVEIDAKDRRHTRDAAAVTSVLDALGPADAWTASGMPRCMPRLWARLTPRSGEGGAAFLFCGADAPAYIELEHNAKAIFQHTVSHLGGAVEEEPRSALESLAEQLP